MILLTVWIKLLKKVLEFQFKIQQLFNEVQEYTKIIMFKKHINKYVYYDIFDG